MSWNPVRCKRIYEPVAADDGMRILVERLWPRGVRKVDAAIDLWLKEIAPSVALRRWFAHDRARWDGFVERYRAELGANPTAVDSLLQLAQNGPLTLVYAARNEAGNSARVLQAYLSERAVKRRYVMTGGAAR